MRKSFHLDGETIKPGDQKTVEIHLSRLADHTEMSLTTHVIHGKKDGPVMFVSAAIHGDEIIGVEIIRRINSLKLVRRLRGTLILVPVVNAYGFIGLSRYLPDRRDLNRVFPGNESGSLASQLAHKFMTEIVAPAQYGIDLHSGAVHRENLHQIRADLDDPEVLKLAEAFDAAIMLNSNLRDGSLRASAKDAGCKILLFEAGEALRFNEVSIVSGVKGILAVMRTINMLPVSKARKSKREPIRSDSSHWLRAPIGGIMRTRKKLGDRVRKGETLAIVSDPLGTTEELIVARASGIVIGRTNLPVVNRGDGVYHVARVAALADAEETLEELEQELEAESQFDDIAII
ncbi:MAG: putative deacylase [Candidatus Azotimanducaceae bacterium]|jgi:predicted deacylase